MISTGYTVTSSTREALDKILSNKMKRDSRVISKKTGLSRRRSSYKKRPPSQGQTETLTPRSEPGQGQKQVPRM